MSFDIDVEEAIRTERQLRALVARSEEIMEKLAGIAETIDDRTTLHAFVHHLIRDMFSVFGLTTFEIMGIMETIKMELYSEMYESKKELEERIRREMYK